MADSPTGCRAGDHSLCDPANPNHGVCSGCGKTVKVSRSSAPPERRKCRGCQGQPVTFVCAYPECRREFARLPSQVRSELPCCSLSCGVKFAIQRGLIPQVKPPSGTDRATRAKAASRARHLRHAQTWDGISDEEILERDGWRCQIPGCKRRQIRKDLKYPHPRSKSVDHIIPLAHGGDDTAVNKRAAHLGCNMARGCQMAPGGEQVGLFGVIREPPLVTRTHNGAAVKLPKPPRLCGICGEPLVAGKCDLHLPVWFRECDHCGAWFMTRTGRAYCQGEFCQKQRKALARTQLSEEAKARKRQRDRERRWVDPAYRARAIAATARWHDRQSAAKVAPIGEVAMF